MVALLAAGCARRRVIQPLNPTAVVITENTHYSGATRPVQGLFAAPRDTPVVRTRTLPAPPPSPYGSWDGASVVLVNLQTGERIDLGSGHLGAGPQFDPTSSKFVWLEGAADPTGPLTPARVEVLDLTTHTRRSFGDATTAALVGPNRLFVERGGSGPHPAEVDLANGAERPITLQNGASLDVTYPGAGVTVERVRSGTNVAVEGWHYVVVPRDGNPAIVFRAADVLPDWMHPGFVLALIQGSGSDNFFRIDVDTAQAAFIATAHISGSWLPTVETGTDLVMSDNPCGPDPRLLVYDLRSGALSAVRTPFVPSTVLGDAIGLDGPTQAARLRVDLASLTYTGVLPAPGAWSPNGRWAAIGPLSTALSACRGAAAP